MISKREQELIEKGTPCYVDYSNKSLLTLKQALDRGYEVCSNLEVCGDTKIPCVLRIGIDVARNVMKGDKSRLD